MPWPRDDDKLDRVRALMTEAELDALERRVDEVYGPKYDFTPDSSDESDPWFVVRPKRAYAWTERSYPGSATQFDFD